MYAKVVVDLKTSINNTFDYIIPENLLQYVFVGSRVFVPFGRTNTLAYVVDIVETSNIVNTKQISDVLSFEQELTLEQVQLAKELSENLNASLNSTLDLMIPSFLKGQSKKYIILKDLNNVSADVALLFNNKDKVLINNDLMQRNDIKKEIKKGTIELSYDFYTYGKNKKIKTYYLLDEKFYKSQIRNEIVTCVKNNPGITEDLLCGLVECSKGILKLLVEDSTLKVKEKNELNEDIIAKNINIDYSFNYDQNQEMLKFYEGKNNKPYLLYSNDEEFKANFYLDIVKKSNGSVLIVTPTIMICEELYSFFKGRTNGYHIHTMSSMNSKNDNYTTWMNVRYNKCDVVICTKLGTFLPFEKLDTIIIIDENHSNYIDEKYPYYNTLEVLKYRSNTFNAKLIISSSTPSVESYYNALCFKYYTLRYNITTESKKRIIDMKEEILSGSNTLFSNELINDIQNNLNEGKQTLLIVNNKSFSSLVKCRNCGKVIKCPKCKVSLVYFKEKGVLKCPYCDYKINDNMACECGSTDYISLGFGLEKVEEELNQLFKARVIRVDSDNISSVEKYRKVLLDIEDNNIDIIIGTNVLTKLLKCDNIFTIGLLTVDNSLNSSDYRASENTFSLIAKNTNKNVIVQTFNPTNYVILNGIINDYNEFYKKELENRILLHYPPLYEMNCIIITGEYKEMYHFANYFKKVFKIIEDGEVLGPAYDYKSKGVKLIIKHNDYPKVKRILNESINSFKDKKIFVSFEKYPKGM